MSIEWGPLQLIPPGFLGWLQLKNIGKNPELLPSTLQAQLNLFDWYMEANTILTGTCSTAAQSTGIRGFVGPNYTTGPLTGQPLIVPSNENWYVLAHTVFADLAAGDTVAMAGAYIVNAAASNQFVHVTTTQGPVTGANKRLSMTGRGFFCPPGSWLGMEVQELTSAGVVLSAQTRYVRLPL